MGVPAAEAVLVRVEVRVAELAAALRVQTATVRERRAAVLAVALVAAPAAGQVLVLLRVEAPQPGPVVAQPFPVDREVIPAVPGLDPAVGPALQVVVALALAPVVVVQASPADRAVVPVVRVVVRVSGLPAALREVRPEDRAEQVVQVVQAAARAVVEAGAALVAGREEAREVALVVGRAVVGQGVAQRTAVPAPAVMANVV